MVRRWVGGASNDANIRATQFVEANVDQFRVVCYVLIHPTYVEFPLLGEGRRMRDARGELLCPLRPRYLVTLGRGLNHVEGRVVVRDGGEQVVFLALGEIVVRREVPLEPSARQVLAFRSGVGNFLRDQARDEVVFFRVRAG